MKPINEMTLSECLEALCEKHLVDEHPIPVYKNDRQDLADRIHELTRWIPVSERMPSKEDAPSVVTMNQNMKCCITLWHNLDKLKVPATHWRRIDTP